MDGGRFRRRPSCPRAAPDLHAKLVAGMGAAPDPVPLSMTLPLDPQVVDRVEQGGPDWQARIAGTLKKAAGF